jgi:hypothetical protein
MLLRRHFFWKGPGKPGEKSTKADCKLSKMRFRYLVGWKCRASTNSTKYRSNTHQKIKLKLNALMSNVMEWNTHSVLEGTKAQSRLPTLEAFDPTAEAVWRWRQRRVADPSYKAERSVLGTSPQQAPCWAYFGSFIAITEELSNRQCLSVPLFNGIRDDTSPVSLMFDWLWWSEWEVGEGIENLVYPPQWDFKSSFTRIKILRHGTTGFTSHPKGRCAMDFYRP